MNYLNKIKSLRQSKFYSQQYMADKLNMSQKAYSSLENGKTQMSVNRLLEIIKFLDVNISDILGNRNDISGSNNDLEKYYTMKNKIEVLTGDKTHLEQIIELKNKEIEFLKTLVEQKKQ